MGARDSTPARWVALALALSSLSTSAATQPQTTEFGANPALPEPDKSLIPTINIATADTWPPGTSPIAAPGTRVVAYAQGLDHPRWLYVLPNGDVLVAETAAPERPEEGKGIRGAIMRHAMTKAGSVLASADRITLLRDADGDGVAEMREPFIENLHSPFGMALVGNELYVANTDAIVSFPYADNETRIKEPGKKLLDLPGGALNHHWTKNVIASPDGSRLYVTVGSNSTVGENGRDKEDERAAVWEVDRRTGEHRIYASGLRNANGLAWEPHSGALWAVVNERDELGDELVPDYMTALRDGGFYGWPYSYYGQHVDSRVKEQRPELVERAIVPDYALGSHTASLGLAFSEPGALPAQFAEGAFVGQHGSWNRKEFSGYKVIFVPFRDGAPAGAPVDVLTGFVTADDKAYGRPVGVALDREGALLVADDVGDAVWRVTATTREARSR
jgi:glucose/arabinose dehydrogenase